MDGDDDGGEDEELFEAGTLARLSELGLRNYRPFRSLPTLGSGQGVPLVGLKAPGVWLPLKTSEGSFASAREVQVVRDQ